MAEPTAAAYTLTLAHLYPELMSTYGDRGNLLALQRRAAWRGIVLRIEPIGLGVPLDPDRYDLYFFGGGQDREQAVVADDLQRKGPALRAAAAGGAVMLAICGGYQLLGHEFRTGEGAALPGVGVLDVRTVAGARRHIGNVIVRCELDGAVRTLVGFENHSGQTYLGPGARPLGRVEVGAGNNGADGTEGAVCGDVYGCYLHGSLLPKNPWFADHLLRRALVRRYGVAVPFPPLDDSLEERAHQAVLARVRTVGRAAVGVR
ncbi:MAG TPA: glutamine amidotransferase [Chloroflexota bacterium]|jgi:CobQ-like glutamine amidotransferase family enzyme|nr:glutamine amidotransferase [Chloroflexota bacterium]